MVRRWIGLLALGLVLALTLWGLLRPSPQPGVSVRLAVVREGRLVREVSGYTVLEAEVYVLSFPKPGRVARVLVAEGDRVAAGQPLALLDLGGEALELSGLRAQVAALRGRLSAMDQEARLAQEDLRRQLGEAEARLKGARELFALGALARSELQSLEAQVEGLRYQLARSALQAQAQRAELLAQIRAQEARIQALEETLAQGELRAPVAGTVLKVGFRPGEVSAGEVRLLKEGSYRFRTRLPEAQALEVRPGMPARVELDALPGRVLQARVERLSGAGEVQPGGGAVVEAFLRPEGAWPPGVRPGLTGTARIQVLALPQALLVPLEALVEEGGKAYLWTVDRKAQAVQKRPVRVLARNLTQAAVAGVEAGAWVVRLPPEGLAEGRRVRYTPPE